MSSPATLPSNFFDGPGPNHALVAPGGAPDQLPHDFFDKAGGGAKPPDFWNSFGKQITTNSPLNPANWGDMIKSAFDSPFSEEHMAEAERQAEIFKSGKAPALQPGEAESMAGEGAGDVTNAVIMGLLTAGIAKGYGIASARAAAMGDAFPSVASKIVDHVVSKGVQATTGVPSPIVKLAIKALRDAAKNGPAEAGEAATLAAASPAPVDAAPPEPAPPNIEVPASYTARPDAIPSEHGVLPPLQRSQFFRPLAGDAPVPAAAPAVAPEVTPQGAAAAPAPEPESMEAADPQRHPVADANRVKAADRWAFALHHLGVAAPPIADDAAWARLSRNLGERDGYTPALDTRQMIHERLAQ